MKGKPIFRKYPVFIINLTLCLMLIVLLFGCKDKSEKVSSEQQKEDAAVKEQKQEASTKRTRTIELALHPASSRYGPISSRIYHAHRSFARGDHAGLIALRHPAPAYPFYP